MKKLLYILLVSFSISAFMTSCTEEEVAPQEQLDNGGGHVIDPKSK